MVIDEVGKYQMIRTDRFAKILSKKSALIAKELLPPLMCTGNTKKSIPIHFLPKSAKYFT